MDQPQGHILVVDDEPPIRILLAELLRRRGYEVTTAMDGHEALAQLDRQRFDLLLLDVQLPGLSGLEVALQARARNPAQAVLILTGSEAESDAEAAYTVGIFDYLHKTTSPEQVLVRIRLAIQAQP